MFSKFFIERPVLACVLSILIVLLGGVSYFTLPVEQYPELAPPVVRVTALYPGANAQDIADTVAQPLEAQVNGVDRMIYMTSNSSDGRYQLDISFEPGTDVDIAAVLVQNRVSIAEPTLPEEVRRLGITTRKQSTAFVGVVSIWSPDGKLSDTDLANYALTNMRDEFARIYGVGGIDVLPNKEYGMRVWLDPQKLKARELTVAEVSAAIREQNVQVAAGAIGRAPAPAGTDFELTINTLGRLSTPEQFGDIIVKTGADGAGVVRLREVARVELGTRDYSTIARFNGQSAAVLPIYQLPGANLTAVASAVETKLEELKGRFPPEIQGKFFYNSSMFIRASLDEVTTTLIEAFILVAVVVLVFLQNWRSTLIPLIVIPVSLIGTFLFMSAFGFSVNTLTMFGLVLAIGIVVDDAIVVVENVERNLAETALPVREATALSMQQIIGAVVAITLVLMSVFIPTAGLPGITGTMYRQFALTIAAATFLSAICAVTLTPALCGLLLKRHDAHDRAAHNGDGAHGGDGAHRPRPRSKVMTALTAPGRWFNRSFDATANGYGRFARVTGRLAPVTMAAFVAVLALTAWFYTRVPSGFVPNEDLGFVVVAAQLPDAASVERSDAVIRRVAEIVRGIDGVQDAVSLSGFSVIDGQGSSYANTWVVLEEWDDRLPRGRSVEAVMADIREKTGGIQEAQLQVFSLPAISGLGNTSGFDMRILAQDATISREQLGNVVADMQEAAVGQEEVLFAFTTFRQGVPQLFLEIDREKVKRFGIPLNSVFGTLQSFLGQTYVNDFTLFGRPYQVNVQAEAQYRLRAEDINRLEVRNDQGEMVPLASLVTVRDSYGPNKVERYNMYRAATLNGIPAPGYSSGQNLGVMEAIAKERLPAGVGFEWSTMSYQEKLVGNTGIYATLLAILLVYLILAAQYESWTAPLAVVLSVPLVALGAMVALDLRGLDNNVFTQIGMVLLVGLGAKNAILIVEFARQNRATGAGILDSAVEAARTRFRPILMTSFAFILGVLPLVIASGAGAASRQSLGTAVFGGMIGVTILGLIFTPALYVVITWLTEKVTGGPRRTPKLPASLDRMPLGVDPRNDVSIPASH